MHQVLVFLHIPKCGGTTVNRALRLRLFSPLEILKEAFSRPQHPDHDFDFFAEEADRTNIWRSWREWAYYKGRHQAYGVHNHMSSPCKYITILRQPESWVQSAFHFTKNAKYDDISIEDFAKKGRQSDVFDHRFTDNVMTRMLCGEAGRPSTVPVGSCTEEMLEVAKRRLTTEFAAALVLERLDESLLCMMRKFGWRHMPYITSNVNRSKPSKNSLKTDQLELIRQVNKLDIQLYECANRMLDENLEKYGPNFKRDLESFRRFNRRFAKIAGGLNEAFTRLRNQQTKKK